LGTVKQFAVLARDFFSRLARRQLREALINRPKVAHWRY
jgi:hypothetical protein